MKYKHFNRVEKHRQYKTQFLLLSKCFLKSSTANVSKFVCIWEQAILYMICKKKCVWLKCLLSELEIMKQFAWTSHRFAPTNRILTVVFVGVLYNKVQNKFTKNLKAHYFIIVLSVALSHIKQIRSFSFIGV